MSKPDDQPTFADHAQEERWHMWNRSRPTRASRRAEHLRFWSTLNEGLDPALHVGGATPAQSRQSRWSDWNTARQTMPEREWRVMPLPPCLTCGAEAVGTYRDGSPRFDCAQMNRHARL